MRRELSVAGVAQRLQASAADDRLEESIFQVASAALEDAGLDHADIDNVVIAASDAVDGRAISSMLTAGPAGAYLKDEIKVADEGSFAVVAAALRLLTGEFDRSLVVSWSRPSECSFAATQHVMADPFFTRPFGLNHVSSTALMAGAWQHRYSVSSDVAAEVVACNRAYGQRNPLLTSVQPVTVDEVRASRRTSWPLRELEMAPESDGIAAVVLTAGDSPGTRKHGGIRLSGLGWATDACDPGERDLTQFTALHKAAGQAYRMAGITDPLHEFDLAELCDISAWHQLMACEALGLCGPGEAGDLFRSGVIGEDGSLPVNMSGGCLSAWPVFSAGLHRFVECCLQLRGTADQRQVNGAASALAHGCTGFAGQSHCVLLLQAV